ncbi:hypothetical protein [Porphyrobacter sp. YT40]|uniref:hypothetical protein n=1 Tax=Porphyrobacter sp. YT40 TaxID=2547601 RepID=UPI001141BBB8|nr:hypothetical protein [Porphyrobacter sp. YT40]QDH34897.1 hypothetical protein E2E27_11525 [Porphyrobacter sp. YT40]
MRARAVLFAGAALALTSCSAQQPVQGVALARSERLPSDPEYPQQIVTQFSGPGLVCGMGFALVLAPDEQLVSTDRMMDFMTHELVAGGRAAVIYEGNAPEPADVTLETGLDFPSVIAVHLDAGGYERSLAQRLLTRDAIPSNC